MNRSAAATLVLLSACVTPPRPAPIDAPPKPMVASAPADPQLELHRAVAEFVSLAEARQFDALLAVLSKPLRDRYTATLLQRDFGAEPWAQERVVRIKASSTKLLSVQGDQAQLEWAPGRSLRLIREATSWKVAALE